jgi:hypothetical protein
MPDWLPSALIGLAFGLLVSAFNHFLLIQGMRQAQNLPEHKAKNLITLRYGIRYVLNIAALFLVHKNMPMLVATALGLTASKNILFLRHLFGNFGRKGVS